MKVHAGVDSHSKLIHSVVVTSENVLDSQVLGDLLHGDAGRVYGDSAYTWHKARLQESAPTAKDFIHACARLSYPLTDKERQLNRQKSRICPRVE